MYVTLGPIEMELLKAVSARFFLDDVSEISFDGVKSVFITRLNEKYSGRWVGNKVVWDDNR